MQHGGSILSSHWGFKLSSRTLSQGGHRRVLMHTNDNLSCVCSGNDCLFSSTGDMALGLYMEISSYSFLTSKKRLHRKQIVLISPNHEAKTSSTVTTTAHMLMFASSWLLWSSVQISWQRWVSHSDHTEEEVWRWGEGEICQCVKTKASFQSVPSHKTERRRHKHQEVIPLSWPN